MSGGGPRYRTVDSSGEPDATETRRSRSCGALRGQVPVAIPRSGRDEWWAAAIIASLNGEEPPPRFPHWLEVPISDELRAALREAVANVLSPSPHPLEGRPDARKMLDWLRERSTHRLVREILRDALGLPASDGGRTLNRLTAWTGGREGRGNR